MELFDDRGDSVEMCECEGIAKVAWMEKMCIASSHRGHDEGESGDNDAYVTLYKFRFPFFVFTFRNIFRRHVLTRINKSYFVIRKKPKVILLSSTFIRNMLFFGDKSKRSMSEGERRRDEEGENNSASSHRACLFPIRRKSKGGEGLKKLGGEKNKK